MLKAGARRHGLGSSRADIREPPAISQGGRLLAAAAEDFPDGTVILPRRKGWQQRLDQIVGNWGRFEPAQTQPAGRGATVEYRFRNGRQVEFTAHEIKVEKLLDDIKAYLKSNPAQPRLAEDQHRRHRLPAGRGESASNISAGRSPNGR